MRSMKPASSELDRRRSVWEALSDFFLDTELQPRDLLHIARVLAASNYSEDELEFILRYEVAPVLSVNLMSVAGEWAGFDQDWIASEILKRERSWRRRIPSYIGFRMIRGEWNQVRSLLGPLRSALTS